MTEKILDKTCEKKESDILKKEYPTLQKKYSLPSLDNLEDDFGLFDCDSQKHILSDVRKKIVDKLEFYLGIVSNVFEGDASLQNIYESKVLDEEKTELFKIYKRLMKYSRQANILSLSYDERAEAEFIKEFYKEWQTIKVEIKKLLVQFMEAWDAETRMTDDILNYLG